MDMSALTSLSQQSQQAENAYLSLTAAIRGRGNLRTSTEIHDDDDRKGTFFVSQSGGSIRLGQAAERDR